MCKIMCATCQEKSNNRIGHSKAKRQYQAKKLSLSIYHLKWQYPLWDKLSGVFGRSFVGKQFLNWKDQGQFLWRNDFEMRTWTAEMPHMPTAWAHSWNQWEERTGLQKCPLTSRCPLWHTLAHIYAPSAKWINNKLIGQIKWNKTVTWKKHMKDKSEFAVKDWRDMHCKGEESLLWRSCGRK